MVGYNGATRTAKGRGFGVLDARDGEVGRVGLAVRAVVEFEEFDGRLLIEGEGE